MINHWRIQELFEQFIDSGEGSPKERAAAYELAISVPDLMLEIAHLQEQLKAQAEPPKKLFKGKFKLQNKV